MKPMKIAMFVLTAVTVTALVSGEEFSSAKSAQTPKSSTGKPAKIVWRTSFQAAQAEAKKSGKPLLVDFYADWCVPCKMLDKQTWSDASVIREAQKFVAVKVNIDKDAKTAQRYRVDSIPVVAVAKADGTLSSAFLGFRDAKATQQFLQNAHAKARRK